MCAKPASEDGSGGASRAAACGSSAGEARRRHLRPARRPPPTCASSGSRFSSAARSGRLSSTRAAPAGTCSCPAIWWWRQPLGACRRDGAEWRPLHSCLAEMSDVRRCWPAVGCCVAAVFGAPDLVVLTRFWPAGCCRRRGWWLLCAGGAATAQEVFAQWVSRVVSGSVADVDCVGVRCLGCSGESPTMRRPWTSLSSLEVIVSSPLLATSDPIFG